VKNIVHRIDEFLPHKPGEESASVAIQWLSQTLDWIQLWADTDQAHDDSFDAFHPPVRPSWDAGNSHSTHLHL
jgi:hypothetical protein